MHYKIINETKEIGVTIRRVQATSDSIWAKKGELGGWVEHEGNLQGNAWVSDEAIVIGNACVYENALVSGRARVYDNARVFGFAMVGNFALVYNDAHLYGSAFVVDSSQVFGDAHICGTSRIGFNSQMISGIWHDSPLQIQGSKDFINVSSFKTIQIRGMHESFEWWNKHLGETLKYSDDKIKEYNMYLSLIEKIYNQ